MSDDIRKNATDFPGSLWTTTKRPVDAKTWFNSLKDAKECIKNTERYAGLKFIVKDDTDNDHPGPREYWFTNDYNSIFIPGTGIVETLAEPVPYVTESGSNSFTSKYTLKSTNSYKAEVEHKLNSTNISVTVFEIKGDKNEDILLPKIIILDENNIDLEFSGLNSDTEIQVIVQK